MSWTETFFGKYYLPTHLPVLSEKKTQEEVNFIESSLNLPKGSKILDLPCGHGRHSIELAKRGYDVTGVDFQPDFIALAKENAENLTNINFIVQDMKTIEFDNEFDAIINFFTSFGYFSEEENFEVLKSFAKALKKDGKLIIDTVNREWTMKHTGEMTQSWLIYPNNNNVTFLANNSFDLYSSRMISKQAIIDNEERYLQEQDIRLYAYTEMDAMLKEVGMEIVSAYGNIYKDDYEKDSTNMILVAKKL